VVLLSAFAFCSNEIAFAKSRLNFFKFSRLILLQSINESNYSREINGVRNCVHMCVNVDNAVFPLMMGPSLPFFCEGW
jgi:hypothetical protein